MRLCRALGDNMGWLRRIKLLDKSVCRAAGTEQSHRSSNADICGGETTSRDSAARQAAVVTGTGGGRNFP
jgi:hypothetical protein